MLFRLVYDDMLAAAAYLIGCQRTGEAIVIDPERDVDRYIDLAGREGLTLTAVAETHIHADFLSGARELAERTGATVYLSAEGGPEWTYEWPHRKPGGGAYPHRLLRDGDVFTVGKIEFKVLHTPGHTPEHIGYIVTDRGSGADQPMGLASGDFLFVGDLGRPDLLESAAGMAGEADASARRLFRSVRLLDALPDWLQVWPAHGAGSACGKALGAVPQTTVGYEKRFNPALRAATDEGTFLKFILEGQPEPPLYFARMKRENKAGPRVLGRLPEPRRMGAGELGGIDGRRSAVIDTRAWEDYRAGHLPGALSHPVEGAFATDVGSMVGEEEAVVLVAEAGGVEEAVRALVRIGIDDIRGYVPAAELEAYRRGGGALETQPEVTAAEARSSAASSFVLDVRRAGEFAKGHLAGATHIPHTRLRSRLDEVPKDRPVLVYCHSGNRSARACALLRKHGVRATNLAEGYPGWKEAGGA